MIRNVAGTPTHVFHEILLLLDRRRPVFSIQGFHDSDGFQCWREFSRSLPIAQLIRFSDTEILAAKISGLFFSLV